MEFWFDDLLIVFENLKNKKVLETSIYIQETLKSDS